MKIQEIMTTELVCCTPETNLVEVAKMMCEADCGEIPVVDNLDNFHPIGVVTDRDIVCRAVAQGKDLLNTKASQCMSTPCVTISPEMSLEECCRVLEENQIRRVPVVDERGRCCGIVAQADIALHAENKVGEVVREISKN